MLFFKTLFMTSYQTMLQIERQLLVGKIVDLLVYDEAFCSEMIKVVKLKEKIGQIKSKFLNETEIQDHGQS